MKNCFGAFSKPHYRVIKSRSTFGRELIDHITCFAVRLRIQKIQT